jgi:hypothetical protein
MCPAISFSDLLVVEPFWRLILNREKTQIVRKPRKRPIKRGDRLYLYWKQRVPKEQKPVHLIATAICTKVERIEYREFAHDNAFARATGFKDHEELQKFFGPLTRFGSTEYDVIHFRIIEKGNQTE